MRVLGVRGGDMGSGCVCRGERWGHGVGVCLQGWEVGTWGRGVSAGVRGGDMGSGCVCRGERWGHGVGVCLQG